MSKPKKKKPAPKNKVRCYKCLKIVKTNKPVTKKVRCAECAIKELYKILGPL